MNRAFQRNGEQEYIEMSSIDELEAWKTKLEFAIKSYDATIWEYDIHHNILFSDNANSALIGGLTFEKYIAIHHPNDRAKLRKAFQELISNKTDCLKLDLRLKQSDGSYMWITIHGRAFQRAEDGAVTKIIGLRRNIQDQVEAHTELIESKRKLEEYAIRTQLSLVSGEVVMWDYDVATEVISSLSPTSFMYNGVSKDEFIASIHPDDLSDVIAGFKRFLVYGKETPCTCQFRLNIPERGLRWVHVTATILSRDKDGKPTKLTGLKRDATKEHEMTSELISLRNKADESNRLKSLFLANMSHEIRTPLNAIVGFSNLIINSLKDESLIEYGKVIETNNELLIQLINDVLDLSKIEAGKLEFNMSEICVNELMGQLQQMFQMRVQSGVEVVLDIPKANCYITSERNRLTQVITNFLSNAIKFTAKGSITLGYTTTEDGLYFYVKDTGRGIAPENIPLVFDRFTKFDNLVQGTGLGLSISKMIVERLGGEIGVNSELGIGTQIWFTLPCDISYTSAFVFE